MLDQAARWGEPERPRTITLQEIEPEAPEVGYRKTAKPPSPTLLIRRRWTAKNLGCLIPFIIVWFGFLGIWYTVALSDDDPSVSSLLCPVVHVAAGLLLVYIALRQMLNVSHIRLTDTSLSCRTTPIARRRTEVYRLDEIQSVSQERAGDAGFVVHLAMRSGERRKLQTVANEAEARYLIWAINAWLDKHRAD